MDHNTVRSMITIVLSSSSVVDLLGDTTVKDRNIVSNLSMVYTFNVKAFESVIVNNNVSLCLL